MDKKKLPTANNVSSGTKSKQINLPTKPKPVTKQTFSTTTTSPSNNTKTVIKTSEDSSIIQNYTLFWLDTNINVDDDYYRNTITKLQSIVNNIHVFNDSDECVHFLNKIKKQKVFMLVSGSVSQHILPRIHQMSQLTVVFILCENKSKYESLEKTWRKVRGIFTDIIILCKSLQQVVYQYEEDSIGISLFSANDISDKSLDQLDQSFMYTQLIKEILLELEYNNQSVYDLVTYCRDRYSNNPKELENIQQFQQGYSDKSPIWWYTCDSFIYHMLNWALREQEFDVIIRMAFFICDLHRHIEQVHSEQFNEYQKEFIVYRGQGMTPEQFEKLKKSKGGLISFNNFLSTSKDNKIALQFAERALSNSMSVGILFIINVNSSVLSTPFASINNISYFRKENEILFSMLTIFRIGNIKPSGTNSRLWHIHLTLTSDSDQQLNALIERMRVDIQGPSAFYRLGTLMIKLGEFVKAEEIFETMRKHTSDELEKGNLFYQLGQIKTNQQNYKKALEFYQDALTIYLKYFSSDHSNIATCYNNIGLVYDHMNDYSKVLSFYDKALEIYKKTLSNDHQNVATCCNSIGLVYNSMGDYTKAFSFCKRALEIFDKKLPPIHPLLATSYNNIGLVYGNMKKYSEAVASYKRAVEIGQQVLPPCHPNLELYKQNLESIRKK
ncbi:unnamed protein product [Rotaria sp. Silwood1]|nr:unnamed protein product [Rotaria sp. Silwood1]